MSKVTVKMLNGGTCEVDADLVVTRDAWVAEGSALFGDDMKTWRFRCSTCGAVATPADHQALAPAGGQWGTRAASCCLGRSLLEAGKGFHASKLPPKMRPKAGKARKPIVGASYNDLPVVGAFGSHQPCDWTTGGLFGGGAKIVLVEDDGGPAGVWVFAFASEEPTDG